MKSVGCELKSYRISHLGFLGRINFIFITFGLKGYVIYTGFNGRRVEVVYNFGNGNGRTVL